MDRLYNTLMQLTDDKTILHTIGSMVYPVLQYIDTFAEELVEFDDTKKIDDLADDLKPLMARARVSYNTDVKSYYDKAKFQESFHMALLFCPSDAIFLWSMLWSG